MTEGLVRKRHLTKEEEGGRKEKKVGKGEIIRRYVRHQDRVGKEEEERQMHLGLDK